ncbi:MAG: SusD/RagB family nutrient-binding outer membrane lipoprotein [Bacteroidetes bacterium]|nr:SusD/RagB family nutrient-binding outer membrane lipoprotein [Bacteroidota bacterium]
MKQIKNIFIILIGGLLLASCNKDIKDKQADPNNPTSVPPNLILGSLLTDIAGTGSYGSLGGINSWSSVHAWNQYHCQNYDYYGNNIYSWTNGSFDPYLAMKDAAQMKKEAAAKGASDVNAFEAIDRFIQAYFYYNLTSLFGDVPQAEALEGSTNSSPAYTPQEQVFLYVLNQLDTANSHFATLISNNDNSISPAQDIIYGGNLTLWQKAVNSFKLRVLVALSAKVSDATLNVPAQFAAILGNSSTYPIFTSQDDDFEFKYNPGGANTYSTYPFNPSNYGSIAQRYNMSKTYVDALTTLTDPRVFVTCEPASALWGTDPNPCQFKFFTGASTGEPVQSMYGNASAGLYSFINRNRYYANFTGEPDVLVGYKEMCFNIAEGIERGWASGDAETWYKTGITESMAFYGIDVTKTSFNAYFLPSGANSVDQAQAYPFTFNFTNYYAQPSVQLSGTTATAINQIVLQKYIACFENSGYEGYYNWRRTGVPTFLDGSGVGNNGIIPLRWAYPVSEQVQNKANYTAALSNQQFSADDLNQKMWLLK